jgi:hypothetical protein
VKPYPSLPLILGFDYGLTPACVIGQVTPRGQLRILSDLVGVEMGINTFARDVLKPHLAMNFPGYRIQATGDPAGNARSDSTGRRASWCWRERDTGDAGHHQRVHRAPQAWRNI